VHNIWLFVLDLELPRRSPGHPSIAHHGSHCPNGNLLCTFFGSHLLIIHAKASPEKQVKSIWGGSRGEVYLVSTRLVHGKRKMIHCHQSLPLAVLHRPISEPALPIYFKFLQRLVLLYLASILPLSLSLETSISRRYRVFGQTGPPGCL
jgi:hypothetical protein